MTPSRPYLIRALYQWIVDNGLTPHLLVDCTRDGVVVPQQYVQDGRIILNVAPRAVQGLVLGNERIRFDARFGGTPWTVELPVAAVIAIYARENGRGMVFGDEPGEEAERGEAPAATTPVPGDDGSAAGPGNGRRRGHLKVVK